MGCVLIMLTTMALMAAASAPTCKPFHAIYADGRALCENMWNDAFQYVPVDDTEAYALAYTMWFFTAHNPNDNVTAARRARGLLNLTDDECHLSHFHKDVPGPEPASFTECHPWQPRSCCAEKTVESAETLRTAYGPGWEWDRCGRLSPECERFFVQEACFYECDPNAGFFRRFPPGTFNASNPLHNEWQMHRMPIRGDYCDAWHRACYADLFCADAGGDFFSCAANFSPDPMPTTLSGGVIATIVVVSIVAAAAVVAIAILIRRERRGRPIFFSEPLLEVQMESATTTTATTAADARED